MPPIGSKNKVEEINKETEQQKTDMHQELLNTNGESLTREKD